MKTFIRTSPLLPSLLALPLFLQSSGAAMIEVAQPQCNGPASSKTADSLPDGAIRRITVRFGKSLEGWQHIYAVTFSPDGKSLACRCTDNTVRILAMPDANEVMQLRLCPWDVNPNDTIEFNVRPIIYSPDGKVLATTWPQGTSTKLWETASGKVLGEFSGGRRWVYCVAFSPDGYILAMACTDGIRVWDVETKSQLKMLDSREAEPKPRPNLTTCLFVDARTLIASGRDPRIQFWDWQSGEELGSINPEYRYTTSLAVSKDGQTLATCGLHVKAQHDVVGLWELSSQRLTHELHGSRGSCPGIAISPNGLLVAASDEQDQYVTVWNLYTGKELAKYSGHTDKVVQVAFSPDNKTLVSSSMDGTLLLWKVPELKTESKQINAEKLGMLWKKLAEDNATAAYEAIWELRQTGDQATALIREHIKSVPTVDAEKIKKYVADLDDSAFATRKKAAEELAKAGEQAEPALRKALEGEPSAEVRKQVKSLFSKFRFAIYHGDTLRDFRALQVLEGIGTPKARKVLADLAKGAPAAKLTRDAKAALERLQRREGVTDSAPRP